jgi:hypothetical protein
MADGESRYNKKRSWLMCHDKGCRKGGLFYGGLLKKLQQF